MPRSNSPIRERTIPKVAKRLELQHHHLLRAVKHGDVKTESWGGVVWIPADEEERLRQLLSGARKPASGEQEKLAS